MTQFSNEDEDVVLQRRRNFLFGAAGALTLGIAARSADAAVSPTSAQARAGMSRLAGADALATAHLDASRIAHPGLLVTEADLQRIRNKLAANAEPWVGG